MSRPSGWWVAVVFAAIGLICVVAAAWTWAAEFSFGRKAVRAEGRVVDLQARGKRRPIFAPVVEFRIDGRVVRFISPSGSRPPSYEVGERVDVLHLPDRPEEAVIDSFVERYLLPLGVLFAGLIFGGLGAGMIFAGRKR